MATMDESSEDFDTIIAPLRSDFEAVAGTSLDEDLSWTEPRGARDRERHFRERYVAAEQWDVQAEQWRQQLALRRARLQHFSDAAAALTLANSFRTFTMLARAPHPRALRDLSAPLGEPQLSPTPTEESSHRPTSRPAPTEQETPQQVRLWPVAAASAIAGGAAAVGVGLAVVAVLEASVRPNVYVAMAFALAGIVLLATLIAGLRDR